MKTSLITILFILWVSPIFGQKLEKTISFDLNYEPTAVSIDRQGQLYFASKEGALDKFDQNGKLLFHFSPQKQGSPSIIDAWQGLRTFVYYRDFQEYLFLDRFLNSSERYNIDFNELSNFSGLVTPAGDNNLWLINDQELGLLKIDINNREVLIENKLNFILKLDDLEIQFIRSYQNLLFISDAKHGVFVFDNLGNFIENIAIGKVDFFSFQENHLIYIQNQKLILLDVYTKTKREVSLPNPSYQYVLMENNKVFLVYNHTVDIFDLN